MSGEESRLLAALDLFRASPDQVFVVNSARRIIGRNPAAGDREPADLDAIGDALAGQSRSFEWGERGSAGTRAWYSAVASPIEADGRVIGALVSSREITDLKRSEERARRSEQMMVDTQGVAHLGTWEWDITLPNATWSAELYRIYGLTPETYTPSYEAYLTIVHPDDRQRVIDATNLVFHEHVPYSHDERISRPDGSIRHLHTWAFPVLDDAGKLVRLVGVCQDITDRKAAEEALQRLNAELEQRVADRTRELESFNAMVSHDLQAPLTAIQLGMQTFERNAELPERLRPVTARVRRAIHNMSELVTGLLALASVGEAALQLADLDVSALLTELVTEHRLASNSDAVEVSIAPDLRIHADPRLMRAALTNLLGNAWKYTAHVDMPKIEIAARDEPDGRALFIRDNGIGFDNADAHRLFRPFSRLPNASAFKGTGVGLATAARIVERHRGTVRAESKPGEGATFLVVLPRDVWLSRAADTA